MHQFILVFQSMPECMPKIQQSSLFFFKFILLHHFAFDLAFRCTRSTDCVFLFWYFFKVIFSSSLKHRRIFDTGMFDDLRKTIFPFVAGRY